jgi:hypothetical protein
MRDAVQGGAAPPGGFFGYELRTTDDGHRAGRRPQGAAKTSLQGFYRQEFDEEFSAFGSEQILDFFLQALGPDGFRFVISSGP